MTDFIKFGVNQYVNVDRIRNFYKNKNDVYMALSDNTGLVERNVTIEDIIQRIASARDARNYL